MPSSTKPRRARRPTNNADSEVSKPFLRFYYGEALQSRTLEVLAAIETSQDPTAQRAALAQVVAELTAAGLEYYFVGAMERAQVDALVQESAELALAGVGKLIAVGTRGAIERMDAAQLRAVCAHIRELMR